MQRVEFDIDGLGKFSFRDKTFRDQIKIEAQASEMLGRSTDKMRSDEDGILNVALGFAHVSVLGAEFPPGWSPEALDPLDQADIDNLMVVYRRLLEELARFRAERTKRSQA